MVDELRDVLASNVNEEVAVFRGSSAGELMWMALLCTLTITPIMTIMGLFIGKGMLFFSVSLVVVFIALFVLATLMQQIRRGRPEGYFEHRVMFLRAALGWGRCPFIRHHGRMDTCRTRQIILIGKHLGHDSE